MRALRYRSSMSSAWTRMKSRAKRLLAALKDTALGQALMEAKNYDLTTPGKAIAYSVLVAFFPGIVALISLYGTFADQSDITLLLQQSAEVLPRPMQALMTDQVREVTSTSTTALSFGAVAGLATALWAVSSGLDSLVIAIDTAYDVTKERSIVRARLVALAMGVATMSGAGIAAYLIARLPNVWGLRSIVTGLCVFVWLVALYRYAPNRERPSWRYVLPGAILVFGVGLVGTWLFSWYVTSFTDYNETYGILGGAIVALLWLQLNAIVVVVGAELNAIIEARRGEVQPTH